MGGRRRTLCCPCRGKCKKVRRDAAGSLAVNIALISTPPACGDAQGYAFSLEQCAPKAGMEN